jgi:ferredoxin-type protein NapH
MKRERDMKDMMKRQRVRRTILWLTFLSFPVVQMYLSPATPFLGIKGGILTGSVFLFGILFLAGLIFGRAYCGWLCPVAGFQETCSDISNKRLVSLKFDVIKFIIWGLMVIIYVVLLIKVGGIKTIDPLHSTTWGISMDKPGKLLVYYGVLIPIFLMSVFIGQRSFCHHLCWMGPFLVVGRAIRNVGKWPALQLKTKGQKCPEDCQVCNEHCTMSLDVKQMTKTGKMEHFECVLCGTCVDTCPEGVLALSFGKD